MVILDTSALIELVEESEKGKLIAARIEKERAAITAVTMNEVLVTADTKEEQTFEKVFERSILLPFDIRSARKSIEIERALRKKGELIGNLDIFIAAMSMARGELLITCDNDFKKVEGLKVVLVDNASVKSVPRKA